MKKITKKFIKEIMELQEAEQEHHFAHEVHKENGTFRKVYSYLYSLPYHNADGKYLTKKERLEKAYDFFNA